MGCCISCCVFLPPARCSLNPGEGGRLDAVEEQELRSTPAYKEVTAIDGSIIPCFHFQNFSKPNPPLLLYSHGNAVDLPSVLPMLMDWSHEFQIDTFGYEYPGYGMTAADIGASETGCINAHEAALAYVLNELRIPPHRVILFGQSLGSGVAVDIASRCPEIGGLLLFSPLLSVIRTQTCDCFAATCRCGDYFTSIYKISSVQCRTMIVHGRDDDVVPFAHGSELQEMLEKPHRPVWVDGAGHNDLMLVARHQITSAIHDFLSKCQQDAPRDPIRNLGAQSTDDDGYQGKALPLF